MWGLEIYCMSVADVMSSFQTININKCHKRVKLVRITAAGTAGNIQHVAQITCLMAFRNDLCKKIYLSFPPDLLNYWRIVLKYFAFLWL